MAFRGYLKQSTAVTKTIYMESNANPRIGVTGLAAGITKYLSKAGGAEAAATMVTTELGATNSTGVYTIAITAAQTDTLGEFELKCVGATANHVCDTWEVVSYLPGEQVLVQSGTGTGQISFTSGQVLVQSGTGTGQISLTSGLVTLAAVTHTGAVIPTVTTLTDLSTTAVAEPTSPPSSTAALASKIAWLFVLAKNKITQTSTTSTLYANDSTTSIATSTVSDDGSTFNRNKWA